MAAVQSIFSTGKFVRHCASCSVNSDCLGRGLDGERLDQFEAARSPIRVLRRGQHVFREGSRFDTLYMVRSGTVKQSVTTDDGDEQIINFYLPGDLLGMDGIEDEIHRTTMIALETSSVCAFPFQKLNMLCRDIQGLQEQMWRLAGRELMNTQKLLLTIGQKGAEARLATFLLSLSSRLKRLGYSGTEFRLAMSRQEIADYLGLSLETVCRIFTRLQEAGIILRDRRLVKLLDVASLEARTRCAGEARAEHRLVA